MDGHYYNANALSHRLHQKLGLPAAVFNAAPVEDDR
jgi:hypothetical protein